MAPTPKSGWRKILTSIPVLVIVGLLLVWWQRQWLYDQARLLGYSPEPAIVQLADQGAMSDYARRIYYVNRPELIGRDAFSSYCSNSSEETVVLGCYIGGQRGIYLLKVDNAELKGIEQVTAAHEMLHAAYDRLADDERQRIDALLNDYYKNELQSDIIKQTIDGYRKTEPNDLLNEMHSIFATQIKDLPDELKKYYDQYFTNRDQVIAYYNGYEAAFTKRQNQIKQYDDQLNAQKQQIDQLEQQISSQRSALDGQRSSLNRLRQSGNYEAYNSGVDAYNAAVRSYNTNVSRLQALIASYNQIIKQRNAIAFEERQLVQSLTAPATIE